MLRVLFDIRLGQRKKTTKSTTKKNNFIPTAETTADAGKGSLRKEPINMEDNEFQTDESRNIFNKTITEFY